MGLSERIAEDLKSAMKNKEKERLEAIRAVKSAILIAQTESGASLALAEADEIKMLQRLVKQRRESAAEYSKQGRQDLADVELAQADVIAAYLPAQLTEEEVEAGLKELIAELGIAGPKEMGKLMAAASAKFGGSADGKTISAAAKKLLS
jgi:uncharacterized protein